MGDCLIHTDRITKLFRGRAAVRDVSLQVEAGSVYAFLGPNGAGKSTTIRMLLGLSRPSMGTITIFGKDVRTELSRILARVGSLVEMPSVYEHLSARENLEIPRRILGAARSDIDRVLQIVGLQSAGGKLVRAFSLGMKQRLGLAQALIGRRDLLILDEPTNGLDPAGIQEMRLLIRSLPAEHGMTVFLSSHLLTEVEQMATHVGMLSQGRLVFQGTIGELERMRQACLRIGVSELESAWALLHARGWMVKMEDGQLVAANTAAVAEMNRALVEAGFEVHHLAVESASLEDVFLRMTQSEAC